MSARRAGRRGAWRAVARAAAIIAVCVPVLAHAQVLPPSAPPALPGRDRPVPDPGLPPTFDFTIQAPRRSPVPRAVEDLSFEVKDIRINGATVYRDDQLRPLVDPLVGKLARLADIVVLAEL